MQRLGKLILIRKFISNELEKYMRFNINNKLNFTDSFQFLSTSLVSLVKIWVKLIVSIGVKNLMVNLI